jgi:LCP family protein required for cell wall assembly
MLVGIALIGACLFSAWTIKSLYDSVGQIDRVDLQGVLDARPDDDPGGPRNILLIGSTENDGIDPNDPLLEGRDNAELADTIMLLRLEPNTGQAAVLSINRDMYVRTPTYEGKINGALETGGPASLVRVVQTVLGVPVNNYVKVNFAGFRKLVDEVDGVPVYFEYPGRDLGSFFETDAGCHVLNGEQALSYVRSRKYQQFINGAWTKPDPTSDHARTERQRDFLILMLDRVIHKTGRTPSAIRALIGTATDSHAVTLDQDLSVKNLIDLGMSFANFDPDNLQRYAPVYTGATTSKGADILLLDEAESAPYLDIFRGLGNTLEPRQVTVKVLDARGKIDEPIRPDTLLQGRGFQIQGGRMRAAGGDVQARTTITYSADQRNAALLLARHLVSHPQFVETTGLRQLTLTVGTDWQGLVLVPWPEDTFAGTVPGVVTTAPAPNDNAGGAAPTTSAPTTTAKGASGGNGTTTAPSEPTTTTPPAGNDTSTTQGIIGRPPDGVTCG